MHPKTATEQIYNYVPHFNNIVTLLHSLSKISNKNGKRPLVLFTSGCKDYGTSHHHLSPDLRPHTEQTPINPPLWALSRATNSLTVISDLKNLDLFDAIVLRPTTIYGYHSSFYGPFFDIAAIAKQNNVLELPKERMNAALHATHVDDCGEAYVALANTYLSSPTGRDLVKNKPYNISSYRYETLSEVANALVQEYDISGGVKWLEGGDKGVNLGGKYDVVDALTGFSQWVGSEQLRKDTGWRDRRMLFTEGVGTYRKAYEAAVERGDLGVERIRKRVEGWVRYVRNILP